MFAALFLSIFISSVISFNSYAIFLSGHNYSIQYRMTRNHDNADCLLRLPINLCSNVVKEELPHEIDFLQFTSGIVAVTQESIEIAPERIQC